MRGGHYGESRAGAESGAHRAGVQPPGDELLEDERGLPGPLELLVLQSHLLLEDGERRRLAAPLGVPFTKVAPALGVHVRPRRGVRVVHKLPLARRRGADDAVGRVERQQGVLLAAVLVLDRLEQRAVQEAWRADETVEAPVVLGRPPEPHLALEGVSCELVVELGPRLCLRRLQLLLSAL